MRRLMCWLFDHDRMKTSARRRVCLRCGQEETLRYLEHVLAWEEVTQAAAVRGSRA